MFCGKCCHHVWKSYMVVDFPFFRFCSFQVQGSQRLQPILLGSLILNRSTYMITITYIIIKKYSVYPIDFVCFFDMDAIMRGAAWRIPLNLSFFWVVRSEPPFLLYRRVHDVYQNTAKFMSLAIPTWINRPPALKA